MLKFHAALIDPSPGEITEALTEAAAGANKRCRARKLDDKPAEWRKFARETAAAREGWRMWRGGRGGVPASQVVGAWWADHNGRKHVVVRGRRVEDPTARRLLHAEDLGERCPLWHAYPEYVYRRVIGKTAEWVCACGCGAVGTPEALGWMGRTCGPCFDREQEFGRDALRENRPGVLYGEREPLWGLAVSPDGKWVAAREGMTTLDVWDAATAARREKRFEVNEMVADLAFTGAGTLLVAHLFRLLRCDPADDPLTPSGFTEFGGFRVVPLRDPDLILLNHFDPPGSRLDVVRVSSGSSVRSFALPPDVAGQMTLTVSPDERFLALRGTDRILVLDLATFRVAADVGYPATTMTFSRDSARLFVTFATDVVAFDTTTWRRGKALGGTRDVNAPYMLTSLATSPDGAHLYAGDTGGRLSVFDTETLATRVVFDWHLGDITGLVASADGELLYTSGSDGAVKVWPIRQLLAAGGSIRSYYPGR